MKPRTKRLILLFGVILVIAAGCALLFRGSQADAVRILESAEAMRISTDDYQALTYAAIEVGIPIEHFEAAFRSMNAAVDQAFVESDEPRLFGQNFSLTDADGVRKYPLLIFYDCLDAACKSPSEYDGYLFAQQVFGFDLYDLAEYALSGSGGIQNAVRFALENSTIITPDNLAALAK